MKLILSDDLRRHPKFPIACHKDGSIFSLKTGRQRSLWKTRLGYLQLAVGRTSYLAHRLVADAFLEMPSDKNEINHKNGVKDDNRIDNLEWCSRRENIIHARDILNVKFGVGGFQNNNAKFFESHQIILRNLYIRGFSQDEMSEIMGFGLTTIQSHLKKIKNDC